MWTERERIVEGTWFYLKKKKTSIAQDVETTQSEYTA